jgi:hypothetical protein
LENWEVVAEGFVSDPIDGFANLEIVERDCFEASRTEEGHRVIRSTNWTSLVRDSFTLVFTGRCDARARTIRLCLLGYDTIFERISELTFPKLEAKHSAPIIVRKDSVVIESFFSHYWLVE